MLSHLARVARLSCYACGRSPTDGCCAHHVTYGRALGRKAPDEETIPLCPGCHDDFHAGRGRFRGWSRDQRNEWQRTAVSKTQRSLQKPT